MIISRTPQKDFCFLSPTRGSWKVIWLPQFQDKAVWRHWNQQHEQEEKEESDLLKKCFLLSHMDLNNLWSLSELWPEKALVHLLTHDTSVSSENSEWWYKMYSDHHGPLSSEMSSYMSLSILHVYMYVHAYIQFTNLFKRWLMGVYIVQVIYRESKMELNAPAGN